ncbi:MULTISPECIES: sulfatase family protein [Streptomyces]|uniref:Arylsulfatase A-like enzyme n=2 Tax=Streptomyces TaxID=1883 RepID=A0ABT9LKE4_STRGD|nr:MULTISPECIES: sulfatase-like hydrolase/transferase [Streptomyces]MDP9684193.1 arylsulfatase A-like enzyme [Streptomyces griseoviridis]GGT02320.1 N-acetylgalactosamine-6-sulfatase [Streptomyces griseoviridis]GGU39619.1 N-acetylgalactosamine-6-sulfatase [Streptomyces daghestanicus]GHI30855.1 N-acetylgalactosamine-6-sulfatase [Streptomyces daghestanicus]
MPEISRRVFGGLVGGGAVTAVAAASAPSAGAAVPAERPFRARGAGRPRRRPNILFILGDDLGWADLSSYGAPHIRTPNLDRLAARGVRFTDAYSGSATCSPTRFSLYTGRHPGRTRGGLAEPIGNRTQGLEPGHPTLASLLKKAGYATALIGKWHCGFLPDYSPTRSGWDEFFGNFGGALEYFSKLGQLGEYDLYEGDAEYKDLRYYTTVLTERAVEYVSRDHHAPWLLNLNFTTPHWPWLTEDDAETGARIAAEIRAGGGVGALLHGDGGSVAKYTEMVESLDASVGEVLTALRRSGQEDDTLVVFASDNGGERFSYQWPLSGAKSELLEGGIRVPTILRWPAAVDARQVSHEPVYSPDWTATLLELAGARPDPAYPLDGHSLAGYLLRGEELPERDLFWRVRGNRALRRGDWKYFRDADGKDHLFHLAEDVREQADRAADRPELLAELKAAWEKVDGTLLPYSAA